MITGATVITPNNERDFPPRPYQLFGVAAGLQAAQGAGTAIASEEPWLVEVKVALAVVEVCQVPPPIIKLAFDAVYDEVPRR